MHRSKDSPAPWLPARATESRATPRKPRRVDEIALDAAIAALSPSERRKLERHLQNGGQAYVQLILS